MKIAVDQELCSGHGRCYSVAPGVFSADEDGFCAEAGTEFVVPDELVKQAQLGVGSCPEGAIREIGT
jgi:ferredoxin